MQAKKCWSLSVVLGKNKTIQKIKRVNKMAVMKYLFYKLYKVIKIIDTDSIPEWTTTFLFTILEVFNLAVLLELFNRYVLVLPIEQLIQNKLSLPIVCIILFVPNYYNFIKDKKYILIEKLFMKESQKKKILGNIMLTVYLLLSILLFLFVWVKQ